MPVATATCSALASPQSLVGVARIKERRCSFMRGVKCPPEAAFNDRSQRVPEKERA